MPRIAAPAALAMLVALIATVAIVLVLTRTDESGGPEEGVTLQQVADDPRAFDVRMLSQWRADTIPEALDPTPLTDAVGEDDVQPRDIPDQAGDVFLALRFFAEGGPRSPSDE